MSIKNNAKAAKLLFHGFLFQTAKEYLAIEKWEAKRKAEGSPIKRSHPFTVKQIMSLIPFDRKFDKIFVDKLTTSYVLDGITNLMLPVYFIKVRKEGKLVYISLEAAEEMEPIEVLMREGALTACPSKNPHKSWRKDLRYEDSKFCADEEEKTAEEMKDIFDDFKLDTIIMGYAPKGEEYRVCTLNSNAVEADIVDRYRVQDGVEAEDLEWNLDEETEKEVVSIASKFPEIEYMDFSLTVHEGGFYINKIDVGRDMVFRTTLSEPIVKFISDRLEKRQEQRNFLSNTVNAFSIIKKYRQSYSSKKKGFVDYMERNWKRGLREDHKYKGTNNYEKKWAHSRGFYSWRIEQYGLTDENYHEFLSDYDYKWLRPLNNEYRKWLWDKLELYYVLSKFRDYLPKYYYHLIPRGGSLLVGKMWDCPEELASDASGVCELLREKKILAMKLTIGSHGDGFYKLTYDGTNFMANDEVMDELEFQAFINSKEDYYLITEYAIMHEQLLEIYDKVACTVRVMVMNRSGHDPVLESAYFRIGTSEGGFTDNVSRGGLQVLVDPDTGEYKDAEKLVDHQFISCRHHPDTGTLIEGFMPRWDEVKQVIKDVSNYISPLEYLGFDIVITDDGLRILEINTHQEIHKYPMYPQSVKDYFNHKLTLKKKGVKLC